MHLLLTLSFLLLAIGLTLVLTQQNAIFMLMGIELITHGAHLNIMMFSGLGMLPIQGHLLIILSMVITVCEIVLNLAIILQIYRYYQTNSLVHSATNLD
jgi:NADH:ubiquinone oxidoreductase subunit K